MGKSEDQSKTQHAFKSLDDFLTELKGTDPEPEHKLYEEQNARAIQEVLTEINIVMRKVVDLCEQEIQLIQAEPFWIQGMYLREEFTTKLTSLMLQNEETIYCYSSTGSFDAFKAGSFIHNSRGKGDENLVSLRIMEDRIYIKMPHLPKRYHGSTDLCNQVLAAAVYNSISFPTWANWTANYYHIFPADLASVPKDVDNYSYKRTNDILAYALGSCDNAFRFNMSMHTFFTDEIPPGTYIEILPKNLENIDFLKSIFTDF